MKHKNIKEVFIVHFDEVGYYADEQPNYGWSFTHNIMKAKQYLTYKGANSHIRRAATIPEYSTYEGHIVKVSVTTTIKEIGVLEVYNMTQEKNDKREAELSNIIISL
jgi:hypothetical protein